METSYLRRRSGKVLAFGLVGMVPIVGTIPFACAAWMMATRDLRDMAVGGIDPAERRRTQAALACGIVGTCLGIFSIVGGAIYFYAVNHA